MSSESEPNDAQPNREQLTTASGIPVGDNQNSLTVGPRGPILIEEQAKSYHINPFDLTKVWPQGDFPLFEFAELSSTGTLKTTSRR